MSCHFLQKIGVIKIAVSNRSSPLESFFLIIIIIFYFYLVQVYHNWKAEAGIVIRQRLSQISAASIVVSDASFFSLYSVYLKLSSTMCNQPMAASRGNSIFREPEKIHVKI